MSWFNDLFIQEAKKALLRHSGTDSGSEDDTQMYVLIDDEGNEYPAVLVGEETLFNATANDIREGMIAATDAGVVVGTKEIPAYITTEGVEVIPAKKPLQIKIGRGKHAYTKLQAVVCTYNTSLVNSVAVEKTCIEDKVYSVMSTVPISTVTIDDVAKSINLGITNDGTKPVLIRYFTYKEEY